MHVMHVFTQAQMRKRNTFGIDATAAIFLIIEKPTDIPEAVRIYGVPTHIVGEGSNIIMPPYIDGVVRHIAYDEIIHNDSTCNTDTNTGTNTSDKFCILTVGAGLSRNTFVQYTLQHGYRGCENMIAIPGTVGASVIQNTGAYGQDIEQVCECVHAYDFGEKKEVILPKTSCHFAYRDSVFKHDKKRYCVYAVSYRVSRIPTPMLQYGGIQEALERKGISHPTQQEIATTIREIRLGKLPDPAILGNCGSFFKNPIISHEEKHMREIRFPLTPFHAYTEESRKIPAARLIEQAGGKGFREGNVGTYQYQPLIVVNHGGATAEEVRLFAATLINRVYAMFSITLEPEVEFR